MLVKVNRADKRTEFFETPNYMIGPVEELNEMIVEVSVYNNKMKRIAHLKRPHAAEYIRNYKPSPVTEKAEKPAEIAEELKPEQ